MVVQSDAPVKIAVDTLDSGLELRESWIGKIVVVSVRGELDILTAPNLAAAVRNALAGSPEALVMDLSEVCFMASAGLDVLIQGGRDASDRTRFALVANSRAVKRPIDLLGSDDVPTRYPAIVDAVQALEIDS